VKIEDIRVDRKFEGRLPEPSVGEFEALCDDIFEHGILVPIMLSEDNLLLDGHRRLKAAKALGLKDLPTKVIRGVKGAKSWGKAFAIALNLRRRHLNEAQRADLGSSLLRVERVKAKERKREGGRKGGKAEAVAHDGPLLSSKDRATDRVAKTVGVSRTTFERVERIKREDPELHRKVIDGLQSISQAVNTVKQRDIKKKAAAEAKKLTVGRINKLEELFGKCRTVLMDPPWKYRDSGCEGAAEAHYPTMTVSDIAELPVAKLAHPDGCCYWIWTTWPMIRDSAPHRLIQEWGLRWVGEVVWLKPGLGVGRWLRPATEILILAISGKPTLLESTGLKAFLEAPAGKHSQKPVEAYEFIERLSPETRLEMFARAPRPTWFRWGLDA